VQINLLSQRRITEYLSTTYLGTSISLHYSYKSLVSLPLPSATLPFPNSSKKLNHWISNIHNLHVFLRIRAIYSVIRDWACQVHLSGIREERSSRIPGRGSSLVNRRQPVAEKGTRILCTSKPIQGSGLPFSSYVLSLK
jgi:hypothetical protein